MENLEHTIAHQLRLQLQSIKNKNLYPFMDWVTVEKILHELIGNITDLVGEIVQEQEKSNRKLIAKLNQNAFRSDPERDHRIAELFNQGYSRKKIAKKVNMSTWGVSKALKRLGVNQG